MTYPSVTIKGQCPSKSNSYRIITIRGHHTLGKSADMQRYERDFFAQNTLRGAMINTPFAFDVDVYYSSNRPDLDNALKIILDCLQASKTIANDRLCVEIHARKFVDKTHPRIVFKIKTPYMQLELST